MGEIEKQSSKIIYINTLVICIVFSILPIVSCDPRNRGIPGILVSAEKFSEGACFSPPVAQLDIDWLFRTKTFYLPIASEYAFTRMSEVFLARPSASHDELGRICLTVDLSKIDDGRVNVTNTGYGIKQFYQVCAPQPTPGQFLCTALGGGHGTAPSRLKRTVDYVTVTDNKSYIIFVRCVEDLYKDYKVLTTVPELRQDLLQEIFHHIKRLGFEEERFLYLPCRSANSKINAIVAAAGGGGVGGGSSLGSIPISSSSSTGNDHKPLGPPPPPPHWIPSQHDPSFNPSVPGPNVPNPTHNTNDIHAFGYPGQHTHHLGGDGPFPFFK